MRAMTTEQLVRHLRRLKRTLEQLGSEFAHQNVDVELLTEIDRLVEDGLAADPRMGPLVMQLERLREHTLTPRRELYTDGISDCNRAKALCEEMIGLVG